MSNKRGTARKYSKDGEIDSAGLHQVYLSLRDAVRVERDRLPELDGPATIRWRAMNVSAAGSLPHPDDVRAVLTRALARLHALAARRPQLRRLERALCRHLMDDMSLHRSFGYARRGRAARQYRDRVRSGLVRAFADLEALRLQRPELLYVKLALRRHLELHLMPDQAFGFDRAARGAAPQSEERERQIACAVFKQRFIRGGNVKMAAGRAVRGVSRTQALEAFRKHAAYALDTFKLERLRRAYPQLIERYAQGDTLTAEEQQMLTTCRLWKVSEEQRLKRYFEPRIRRLQDFLNQEARKPSDAVP